MEGWSYCFTTLSNSSLLATLGKGGPIQVSDIFCLRKFNKRTQYFPCERNTNAIQFIFVAFELLWSVSECCSEPISICRTYPSVMWCWQTNSFRRSKDYENLAPAPAELWEVWQGPIVEYCITSVYLWSIIARQPCVVCHVCNWLWWIPQREMIHPFSSSALESDCERERKEQS
jgi:hypothetical protein